jgi:hypothetical protein
VANNENEEERERGAVNVLLDSESGSYGSGGG